MLSVLLPKTRYVLRGKSVVNFLGGSQVLRLLSAKVATQKDEEDGAWAVLAALEKAKEAQGVKVAQLIDGLEAILPLDTFGDSDFDESFIAGSQHQQHTNYQDHTSDPAFFSLPERSLYINPVTKQMNISGNDVRVLLEATRQGRRVDLHTIEALVKAATKHFWTMQRIVSLSPLLATQQLTVIGDLHGSLSDLEAVLSVTGEPTEDNILLFNGDFADRGDHGIEVIAVTCALCLAYPGFVYVNRGNHEDLALSIAYGLAAEVQHKYGASIFRRRLAPLLDNLFRSLPLATVVENDALIVHAGPPPPGIKLADIPKYIDDGRRGLSRTIRTHTETDEGHKRAHELIEALLWSDPIVNSEEDGLENYGGKSDTNGLRGWTPNLSRGAGHKFDSYMIRNLLESEGLTRFVRSHEPVHKGCVRYVVDDGIASAVVPMEFFTVFSASRYPHKEGFNQGAVLRLRYNGHHSVVRYATEEDEPRVGSSFTAFDKNIPSSPMCEGDPSSIRRVLRKVVVSYKSKLLRSLEKLTDRHPNGIPFDDVADVLIQTLQLDEPGLNKPGARIALARAMSIQCHGAPPQTIDALRCIDTLTSEVVDDDFIPEMAPHYPWLRAVFEVIDVDHDGVLSRSDWTEAVNAINARMPMGTNPMNAEDTWRVLDVNGEGHVTSSEWNHLAKILCR